MTTAHHSPARPPSAPGLATRTPVAAPVSSNSRSGDHGQAMPRPSSTTANWALPQQKRRISNIEPACFTCGGAYPCMPPAWN